jgi:hypothetical protein
MLQIIEKIRHGRNMPYDMIQSIQLEKEKITQIQKKLNEAIKHLKLKKEEYIKELDEKYNKQNITLDKITLDKIKQLLQLKVIEIQTDILIFEIFQQQSVIQEKLKIAEADNQKRKNCGFFITIYNYFFNE